MEADFAQTLAFATVSRHINRLQLSFRLTNGRPMPKSMTEEKYVQQYYECVLKLHNEGFFKWDPKKIVCIDCCTNSRPRARENNFNERSKTEKVFGCQSNLYQYVHGCCVSGG